MNFADSFAFALDERFDFTNRCKSMAALLLLFLSVESLATAHLFNHRLQIRLFPNPPDILVYLLECFVNRAA